MGVKDGERVAWRGAFSASAHDIRRHRLTPIIPSEDCAPTHPTYSATSFLRSAQHSDVRELNVVPKLLESVMRMS